MITGSDFLTWYGKNIVRLQKKSPASHDIISDLMLNVYDKLEAGTIRFESWEKLENYFLVSCLNNHRQEKKSRNNQNQLAEQYYYQQQFDDPVDQVSTQNLYDDVMQYVFTHYSFLEAASFKAYIINQMTFQELSDELGWSVNKTWRCFNKIKKSIIKHYELQEFTTASFRNRIQQSDNN